jgi:1,4-alpha-glucan branching enzyme
MVRLDDELVEFTFFRPQARCVHLAGDFNNWRSGELPMARRQDGYWQLRLRLPSGEFRFRYCADGEWFTDFAACGLEPGRFGMDSIVRVPPRTLRVAPKAPKEQDAEIVAA